MLGHTVGDRGDKLRRDLRTVDLLKMLGNLSISHSPGVHREDLVAGTRQLSLRCLPTSFGSKLVFRSWGTSIPNGAGRREPSCCLMRFCVSRSLSACCETATCTAHSEFGCLHYHLTGLSNGMLSASLTSWESRPGSKMTGVAVTFRAALFAKSDSDVVAGAAHFH
jgi:hypothetical protein